MRSMSLDVGTRTIGIAVSDLMGLIANGVETIRRTTLERDYARLALGNAKRGGGSAFGVVRVGGGVGAVLHVGRWRLDGEVLSDSAILSRAVSVRVGVSWAGAVSGGRSSTALGAVAALPHRENGGQGNAAGVFRRLDGSCPEHGRGHVP